MIFQVRGVDKKSGETRTTTIEARDQSAAALMALQVGIMVSEIQPIAASADEVQVEVEQEVEVTPSSLPRPRKRYEPAPTTGNANGIVCAILIAVAALLLINGIYNVFTDPEPLNLPGSGNVTSDTPAEPAAVEGAPTPAPTSATNVSITPPPFNYFYLSEMLFIQQQSARHELGFIKIIGGVLVLLLMEVFRLRNVLRDRPTE